MYSTPAILRGKMISVHDPMALQVADSVGVSFQIRGFTFKQISRKSANEFVQCMVNTPMYGKFHGEKKIMNHQQQEISGCPMFRDRHI